MPTEQLQNLQAKQLQSVCFSIEIVVMRKARLHFPQVKVQKARCQNLEQERDIVPAIDKE